MTRLTAIFFVSVLLVGPLAAQPIELSAKEKAAVRKAQELYGQAVAEYEEGHFPKARRLFKKSAKYLSALEEKAQYALKDRYGEIFSKLEGSLVTEPNLAISPEELEKTSVSNVPLTTQRGFTIAMPVDDELVQKYVTLYTTTNRRETLTRALERSGRYRAMIMKYLEEYKLPRELIYLPIVESRYDLSDVSWAGAVGLWQFMAPTARNYGLQVNFWLDERRDPEKSTQAALQYLKDLEDYFNDWHLALAAYNRGENGIARDLKSTKATGFDGLARHNAIPRETENYVPQFVAVCLIAENLDGYGFKIKYEEPEAFDTVEMERIIDLEVAAQCAGTTVETLHRLNPSIVAWCTPKNYNPYPLRLPAGSKERFLASVSQVENLTPSRGFVRYRVKKGDILGRIATQYKTTARAIQEANAIKNPKHLRPGQVLTIRPGRGHWND